MGAARGRGKGSGTGAGGVTAGVTAGARERLDQALVGRGITPSRARARDAILRGAVRVDGVIVTRPATRIARDATLTLADPAAGYVSRAALKLRAGLDHFGFVVSGRVALDLGASTGGFTQLLLERGAARVHAVDVGHGQFDGRLRADPRVTLFEGLNARDLDASMIGGPVTALTADLSFISLTVALAPALALAGDNAWGVFLVKPQFEVGRKGLGKGGVVRDAARAEEAAGRVAEWLDGRAGFRVVGLIASPITGGSGNREFLLGATKCGKR